jgi:SagB-type dehydrogenase family enzyme
MEASKFTDKITLLEPDLNGGMNLMKAFKERKTTREFQKDKPLTLKQISELLWSCYGQSHGPENHYKTVPSAVGLFPLEIYVLFPYGIYKYNPEKNELILCIKGDYTDKAGKQDFVKNSFMNILIFADITKKTGDPVRDKMMDEFPEKRMLRANIDAGHCMQNVYLYCASEGLNCVERGMCDGDFFIQLLKLEHHKFVISQSVGY